MSISGSVTPARVPAPRSPLVDAAQRPPHSPQDELGDRLARLISHRSEVVSKVEKVRAEQRFAHPTPFMAEWSFWRESSRVLIEDLRHSLAALRRSQLDLRAGQSLPSGPHPSPGSSDTTNTVNVAASSFASVLAEVASCQRALVDIGLEIQQSREQVHRDAVGESGDTGRLGLGAWRHHCADMVTSLAALRALVEPA